MRRNKFLSGTCAVLTTAALLAGACERDRGDRGMDRADALQRLGAVANALLQATGLTKPELVKKLTKPIDPPYGDGRWVTGGYKTRVVPKSGNQCEVRYTARFENGKYTGWNESAQRYDIARYAIRGGSGEIGRGIETKVVDIVLPLNEPPTLKLDDVTHVAELDPNDAERTRQPLDAGAIKLAEQIGEALVRECQIPLQLSGGVTK